MTIRQTLITLFLILGLAAPTIGHSNGPEGLREIEALRTKVIELSSSYDKTIETIELKQNSALAKYQASLLIKVFSYEIYLSTKREGAKRNYKDIEAMVTAAYLCSWIFTDLGHDHMDRFLLILQWAKDETFFNKNLISYWKAGTYLKSINKSVPRDCYDYGVWQINDQHENNLKIINVLYESGAINFKTVKIKKIKDVMDIRTNCVARCIIETDRKSRGWEWRHIKDEKYFKFLTSTLLKIEAEGLYKREFASKYYNVVPVKVYSQKFF